MRSSDCRTSMPAEQGRKHILKKYWQLRYLYILGKVYVSTKQKISSTTKGRLVAKRRIDCISVPGVTFEDLASVKPSNANSSTSEPFHREAQESHHNTSHNLPVYFDIFEMCVCLMMCLNGVFDYFCFIIILCHVCLLLESFKCFLLWCFESRLGLRPKEWTMPARIIEAKACACWIISLDVVFVFS